VCEDWCRPNPTRTACDCSQQTDAGSDDDNIWCATGWENALAEDGADWKNWCIHIKGSSLMEGGMMLGGVTHALDVIVKSVDAGYSFTAA